MQIFDDKKKRIGTLSGFKDRAITTTLDSGDKELTFDYPASGALVDLLKEEYYIRTKTDEFVLKAVEKGEQFNKYTAVLNVEELEGTAFPYGFESDEQTIKACLEFAFEGTGWHVGTCTVTKKRTIDEQESVTAWDVLQKCLTTYRCECIIHSLTKTIDIYDRIGSDRGCYFMEGLNLRKISLKSDTYDFYTRIYPIGKDGITPEWLTGKDYIDNFQYSSKIKAYVWKDERYTNTTSLIEDATAKIEEMSRPYKAYTRIRSLAGQTLMYNTNASTEITRAKANGNGWNIGSWSKRNLLDCMLKIMSKTDNSQTAFGQGQTSGYVNDASQNYGHLATGTLTNKGQFFGYKDTTHEVKVFYIEKWWGNRWDRINGLLMVGGEILAKMTPPYNLTGKDFEKVGITFASSGNGYQKGTKSSRFGRIVNSIGGSSSTYTCDYFWWNAGITAVALVGGRCDNGENCGADCLDLSNSAGVASWYFGASVFLEQPIAA